MGSGGIARGLALAAVAAALALTGCGDDKRSSSPSSASSSPLGGTTTPAGEKPPSAAMAILRPAAADLVRATSSGDERAAGRALGNFQIKFQTYKLTLQKADAALARRIDHTSANVAGAFLKGDLGKAAKQAKRLQLAVKEPVTP